MVESLFVNDRDIFMWMWSCHVMSASKNYYCIRKEDSGVESGRLIHIIFIMYFMLTTDQMSWEDLIALCIILFLKLIYSLGFCGLDWDSTWKWNNEKKYLSLTQTQAIELKLKSKLFFLHSTLSLHVIRFRLESYIIGTSKQLNVLCRTFPFLLCLQLQLPKIRWCWLWWWWKEYMWTAMIMIIAISKSKLHKNTDNNTFSNSNRARARHKERFVIALQPQII